MSFPDNISKHRLALLELLEEAFRDPGKRSALKTRGISMAPLIQERDEVVIQAVPVSAIAVGDLIAFRAIDVLVVHRVAAIDLRDGVPLFWEKGDNNMYLSPVPSSIVLGTAVEVVAGGRRLDLRARRFRWLGRFVSGWGVRAVQVFGAARRLGARGLRPGGAASRAARAALYATLQAPIRAPLALARRFF